MRIAFLGTPEFALPSLEMLIEEGHTLAVFTQPDKPVGRKAVLTPPPVKVLAEKHGIPVYQFARIRKEDGLAALRAFAPDLMVTAAFGQLLSAENLAIPTYGCINVHGSLLPKYRGAAPIQWAVINGEKETGITTMQTDVGMDTGDILEQRSLAILPDEDSAALSARLAILGAETLRSTLHKLQAGTLCPVKQDESQATKCTMLKKDHGLLPLCESAQVLHDRIRGLSPWPGAYAVLPDGGVLKIWRSSLTCQPAGSELPGTLTGDPRTGLFLVCKDGLLEITELQAPGGKRLDGKTFLRGNHVQGLRLTGAEDVQ